jgi:hypothetical protein
MAVTRGLIFVGNHRPDAEIGCAFLVFVCDLRPMRTKVARSFYLSTIFVRCGQRLRGLSIYLQPSSGCGKVLRVPFVCGRPSSGNGEKLRIPTMLYFFSPAQISHRVFPLVSPNIRFIALHISLQERKNLRFMTRQCRRRTVRLG